MLCLYVYVPVYVNTHHSTMPQWPGHNMGYTMLNQQLSPGLWCTISHPRECQGHVVCDTLHVHVDMYMCYLYVSAGNCADKSLIKVHSVLLYIC